MTRAYDADDTGEAHGTRRVERITVTRVISTRGSGAPGGNSPFREVTSYWLDSGRLLVEIDSCQEPKP